MRVGGVYLLLAVLTASLLPAPALAQSDEDTLARARQHYAEAHALYDRGAIEAAMAAFQAAYAAVPDPALLFDIGQCQRRLGRRAEALASYRLFLRLRPNADQRPVVERLIAGLERDTQLLATAPPPTAADTKTGHRPLYRRWWLWTAVGGGAVAALAVGLGVGLAPTRPTASTTVPAFQF